MANKTLIFSDKDHYVSMEAKNTKLLVGVEAAHRMICKDHDKHKNLNQEFGVHHKEIYVLGIKARWWS